jgi:hypothetical protein
MLYIGVHSQHADTNVCSGIWSSFFLYIEWHEARNFKCGGAGGGRYDLAEWRLPGTEDEEHRVSPGLCELHEEFDVVKFACLSHSSITFRPGGGDRQQRPAPRVSC